ncbi:metal-dependent transcriptional regulator [Halopelagius longus]|uniref:Iron (Metal) dependent repressor, DtxR family n=1 Tax=Halopelagius longus TaxID=1236180 RepID=A0A1H1GSV9_9EURY|nr:metal-dependent transcriptional regulator [Halopelagius longus]SDR16267.1 iron (metal) dependent repressor, DtxR family [Halopelagius longus]
MILNAVMEDYLKAIYQLQSRTDGRVKTSEIADRLGVKPPTVSSMIEKLGERNLVDYEKYKGVRLTSEGEAVALEIIRHHRLLEAYLTEHLEYEWDEVHEEADELEHHISEKFIQHVTELLDNPDVDPHGDPIPKENLDPVEEARGESITEYDEGDVVVVERVSDEDSDVLRYLSEHNITPGTEVTVTEVAPFGMVTIRPRCEDEAASLPRDVLEHIRVRPVAGDARSEDFPA